MTQLTIFDQLTVQQIGGDFDPTKILPYRMVKRGKLAKYKALRQEGLRLIQFTPSDNKGESIFRLFWNTPYGSQHSRWYLLKIDLGKDYNFATLPEKEYQTLLKLAVQKSWTQRGLYRNLTN